MHLPIRMAVAFLLGQLAIANAADQAFHNPYGRLPMNATPGDRMIADYFQIETRKLRDNCLADVTTLDDWKRRRPVLRKQLFEMLGLDPLPAKTDLKAAVTGKIEHPEFTVEKLHFQSIPGLYVTGDLYLPKGTTKPAPAILYGCGHSQVKTNGISFGNKVDYQRHGIWFARNGYVCLILDTVQLGEIEGVHHGTYREGMWWWNSRGYTPAGAEAWNCVRALDYLETRPEVDKQRMGVTGRSGGGAYSWWIAALDDRIQVACPVAGITDLQNHVVDGTVEGHCDCMFMVNTHRWDFPMIAALVAPRPLLICNSDKDTIFPLDGVARLHEKVRRIYDLYGATDKLGLIITEGPHRDTQELQLPVFRWFNRFLKAEQPIVEMAAVPMFTGQQLKVFESTPTDEITSKCYENFTRLASDTEMPNADRVITDLRLKTFGGWPEMKAARPPKELASAEYEGVRLTVFEFESQPGINLRLYVAKPIKGSTLAVHLETVDEKYWRDQMTLARAGFAKAIDEELVACGAGGEISDETKQKLSGWMGYIRDRHEAFVTFAPRGVGLTALSSNKKYVDMARRRFMLLGQTLAGMQVYDVCRAAETIREIEGLGELPLHYHASVDMTEVATFATLFSSNVASLTLATEPRPDKKAADFLNWSRVVTPHQLLLTARQRCAVTIQP